MRKPIIAGNWKMNLIPEQALVLIEEIKAKVANAKCDVIVCPPYVDLETVKTALLGTNIILGAQNMHFEASGAFTGEISAAMLAALGVRYVILGHSERRQYFAESDSMVNKKTKAALAEQLIPIVCVGESLAQRDAGETVNWIAEQAIVALDGLAVADVENVVIAYEPIWAIGTGRTPTDEEANEAIRAIRTAVRAKFGAAADAMRIQYGGSMNAVNARGLMAQSEIDGGLIGGASLKSEDFATIVAAASATVR